MKLSKKIISVLLSTSYMFTSIVFADEPEETPKTGTTKLEPVYLTNVAQYMPMTEKIKLEQVNKNCADALKMGYADDFLYVYILLNTLPKNKYKYPILSSYSDFKVADRAFKNSIKYYRFKTETKIGNIPEKLRALCDIDNDGKPKGIIFPRSYNLYPATPSSLVTEPDQTKKRFIETQIFNNKKFTTSDQSIVQLRSHLCNGLLLALQKLENKLQDKIDFDYKPTHINTLRKYFSVDTHRLIDSVNQPSDITPSMLNVDSDTLNAYQPRGHTLGQLKINLQWESSVEQFFYLRQRSEIAKLASLYHYLSFNNNNPSVSKDSVKENYANIKNYLESGIDAISDDADDNEEFTTCLNLYEHLEKPLEKSIRFVKYNKKTKYDVFRRYLNANKDAQTAQINNNNADFLYKFFCCPYRDFVFVVQDPIVTLNVGKLRETISIIDTLMDKKRLNQTDFDKQDIDCPPIDLRYCLQERKNWFDKTFSKPVEMWEGIIVMRCLLTTFSDNTINLDALQTIVYIVNKLGCEPEIIQNMQTALLQNYVPNNAEDINKIKRIFETAGKGKPENLDEDLGTIEYTLNDTEATIHPPIENIARSPKNSNFGPALVGVTGLSVLGALVYNGIKKYKNKPSNISKSKNNKNINKKIAKNIS